MTDTRKQLFLAKPRPDETAEEFADHVLGQLTESGTLDEDGKLAREIREGAKRRDREKEGNLGGPLKPRDRELVRSGAT